MDEKEINIHKLTNFSNINLEKFDIKLDLTTCKMVLAFIYKNSVLRTRKNLSNLYKLFTHLNEDNYENEIEVVNMIWIIRKSLYGKLYDNIETSSEYLMSYCMDDINCDEYKAQLIKDIPNLSISHDESKKLLNKLDDILRYGYIMTLEKVFLDTFNKIEVGNFKSYKEVSNVLYDIATIIINIKRNNKSGNSDQTFSLDDDVFDTVIEDALQKLKDRNRIFITGIRYLNVLLGGGFQSKRLYTFLAFPGKGKSTILLKCALDIKKYNKNIKCKDPDKQPTVLMLTLENDIPETIERLYNMSVDSDDIRNYTSKQIKKKMRREGHLILNNEDCINIVIKEYRNRELDTNDIYGIINDLNDEGKEVVVLIVDYMKRIRPAEKAKDEKGELKNISNELKELAKFFDIVALTAQQLNRSGAAVVNAALQNNKQDVTKLVGSDNIAGAWEIQENSDWTCIINPEQSVEDGLYYMVFSLLKRRYKSPEENEKLRKLTYFNQPFEKGSDIKLVDDIDLPKSVALESLASRFVPIEEKKNATKREVRTEGERKTIIDDFDMFDPNVVKNF